MVVSLPRPVRFAFVALAATGLSLFAADDAFKDLPPPTPMGVVFPPMPPAYGADVTEATQGMRYFGGTRATAPEEIADFVGESFYPALGSRLFEGALAKKFAARLDAYRKHRAELLNALQDKLVE